MANLANSIPTPKGPNRRGIFFYASALLAGYGLKRLALTQEPDPVDAAITAFRQASFDLHNCMDDESEEWGRLCDRRHEMQVALARTAPTTRNGAHNLMSELVLDELGGAGMQGDTPIIIAIGTLLQALPHLT